MPPRRTSPTEEAYLSQLCVQWKSQAPRRPEKASKTSNKRKRDVVERKTSDQDGNNILSRVHQITTLHTLTAKQQRTIRTHLGKKYKQFIPSELPPPQKRCRPVCLFVNYLGTRRPSMTPSTATDYSPLTSAANTVSDDMSNSKSSEMTDLDEKNLDKLFPACDIPMPYPMEEVPSADDILSSQLYYEE